MAYRNDRDINLYKALKNSKAKRKKGSAMSAWVFPPLIIILIIGGVFGYFFYRNTQLQAESDRILAYVNDAKVISDYNETQLLNDLQSKLNAKRSLLESANKIIKSYPKFNREVFNVIEQKAMDKVIIYNITYVNSSGLIQMDATAVDIDSASAFTNELNQSGLFEKVIYGGWNLTSNDRYSFVVSCILKTIDSEVEDNAAN